ncbi:hypothetical protein [Rudaeicoccus suwonensis]|uniref:Uncharacterized protein n=1 Tax=Rudaeicoccus suwonensis TaxID=657409 RepID=A0A561E9V6_9MICO|nr:hypothetical protein [Rudaeicoccus suwonensis]TWE12395.1 hypothetical protein BKA23_1201 [Rudaeicoccus suwonensis]
MFEIPAAVEWMASLLSAFCIVALCATGFARRPARRRPARMAIVLLLAAAVLFRNSWWTVEVGMALTLAATASFIFRSYFKVRSALLESVAGAVAFGITAAALGRFPWVFIPLATLVFVWWITGGVARNRRRRLRHEAKKARLDALRVPSVDVPPTSDAAAAEAMSTVAAMLADPRLPAPARESADALFWRCEETLSHLSAGGLTGRETFEVEQIRDDFAPNAIRTYLALPAHTARTRPLDAGRTGEDLLMEQLTLLHGAVNEVMASASATRDDQMLSHYRFVRDRFTAQDSDLRL